MWEEPCISGDEGSGAVFFSGCNLGCVYCQNREIALGHSGRTITDVYKRQEEARLLRSVFDQIPNEKKTAAFCAAAAAWKAAVRQLRCHGSVGNRSEQP